MRSRRPIALLLLALAGLLVACGDEQPAPGGDAAPGEVARFDDGRVAFDYPDGWEIVEQGGPDEYRTRIEPPGARDEREDLPEASIVVLWPFIASWDLDAAVGAWGPNGDDPAVVDVSEEAVTVPGAEEALAHHYRVRDVTGGLDEDPATYRSVIAMGEVGRTVVVMIAAPDAGGIDVDEVAELVVGTLELEPTWG